MHKWIHAYTNMNMCDSVYLKIIAVFAGFDWPYGRKHFILISNALDWYGLEGIHNSHSYADMCV